MVESMVTPQLNLISSVQNWWPPPFVIRLTYVLKLLIIMTKNYKELRTHKKVLLNHEFDVVVPTSGRL